MVDFSINDAGTIGYLYVKSKIEFLLHIVEDNQFWVLNIKDKTTQFLEGNTKEYFYDFKKRLAIRKKVAL